MTILFGKVRRAVSDFAKSKSDAEADREARQKAGPASSPEAQPASSEREPPARTELELKLDLQRAFDPKSDEIEALFQATFGAGARVVAVIGVAPGDGASSCASALAQRSMLGRRSTLLVGVGHSVLPNFCRALDNAPEFCQRAGADAPHHCEVCIAPKKTAQAVDLAWKRFGDNGDGALMLREPAFLRDQWAQNYASWQAIVVDCEAALADGSAFPGRLVAQSADAVILVALGGGATSESLAAAKAALGSARIVGLAVNGRDQRKVGAEIAQRVRRKFRRFPRLSKFLADRAERMGLFDVVA